MAIYLSTVAILNLVICAGPFSSRIDSGIPAMENRSFVVLFALMQFVCCIYEDQIGKFDWLVLNLDKNQTFQNSDLII